MSLDSCSDAEAGNSASEMSEAEIFRSWASSAEEDSMGEVMGDGGRFLGVTASGGGGKGGVEISLKTGGNGGGGNGGGGGDGIPESSGVSGDPWGGETSLALTISSSICSYTGGGPGGGPGGVRGLGGV